MYKRLGLVIACSGLTGSLWGQQTQQEPPDIKVPAAVTVPTSSVDLLRQSAQQTSPFAPPGAKKKAKTRKKKSAQTPVVNNTLDLPLPVGGSTVTVQAAVAPAVRVPAKPVAPVVKPEPAPVLPSTPTVQPSADPSEEDAADAELAYAVKMLEESKRQSKAGRPIPAPAAHNRPTKVPSANQRFNPNAYRPGVEWQASKSTHFDIYTQKPTGTSVGPANMALAFESAYDTLHRFIPWMMSGRVRVFVYQDHNSFLRYEPEAKAWAGAVAYPTRGEIVVYNDPADNKELKKVFAHELTHIFTQQFFDKHKIGRIMTPAWLDEGLAVLVEDQMFPGARGPWDQDYRTLRFERDPKTKPASFSSGKMFTAYEPKPFVPIAQRGQQVGPRRGRRVRLSAFEDFMPEDSLESAEGKNTVEKWYLQAYLMVRFLLNPAGGMSPSNRMQFEQFTRLVAQGEAVRNPSTGFLVKDSRGKQVYEPYSVEKALGRAYRYGNIASFEDNFWKWLDK